MPGDTATWQVSTVAPWVRWTVTAYPSCTCSATQCGSSGTWLAGRGITAASRVPYGERSIAVDGGDSPIAPELESPM